MNAPAHAFQRIRDLTMTNVTNMKIRYCELETTLAQAIEAMEEG